MRVVRRRDGAVFEAELRRSRYVGGRQELAIAVNDHLGLGGEGSCEGGPDAGWERPSRRSARERFRLDGVGLAPLKEADLAKKMTQAQIVTTLAEKTELSKKVSAGYLEALAALAYKEAKNGFTIPGIGKLVVRSYKARMGRNPQTGASIKIPARRRLKFVVAKAAKDAIGKG